MNKYTQTYFLDRLEIPGTTTTITPKLYCVSNAVVPLATPPVPLGNYDSIFQRKTAKIYIFQGDQYWRLTDKNFSPHPDDCLDFGYPKPILDEFPGLPAAPIDAVFQRDNGKIYFFVGLSYYRFSDKYITPEGNPLLPDILDPAYVSGFPLTNFGIPAADLASNPQLLGVFQRPNGKIYFFFDFGAPTGVSYYRITDKYLTGARDDVVDPGYPRLLADGFEDIPLPIDTVFQRTESDQKIYFYSGTQYTKGTDKYIHVPATCTACASGREED